MAPPVTLEEFADAVATAANAGSDFVQREELEAKERAAYEQGYAAGWDDAIRAEEEGQERITAEFARNLQDLGFTFHEARGHVMRAIEPLLNELVTKFLPAVANEGLSTLVLEEILPLADKAADGPIDLLVPVGMADKLQSLLTEHATLPVNIVEEPSLGQGQVLLRSAGAEKRIDMDEAIAKVSEALAALYPKTDRTEAYG